MNMTRLADRPCDRSQTSDSAYKTHRVRERMPGANLGVTSRSQVGHEWRRKQHIGVLAFKVPQRIFGNLGGQDTSRNLAVLSEVVNDAIERAFQEQVAVLQEDPVNGTGRASGQEGKRWLDIIVVTWRGGETRQNNLARSRKGDGECTLPLDVLIGPVPGCADESEVVLPAQRRGHVFGRQVKCPTLLPGTNDDQRSHHEEPLPDWPVRIERDQGDTLLFLLERDRPRRFIRLAGHLSASVSCRQSSARGPSGSRHRSLLD